MADVASHLRESGFNDDEIANWALTTRQNLTAAGFKDEEVDDYLGLPKTPKSIPSALVHRLLRTMDFFKATAAVPQVVTDLHQMAGDTQPMAPTLGEYGVTSDTPEGSPQVAAVLKAAGKGAGQGFGQEPVGFSEKNRTESPQTFLTWQPFVAPVDALLRAPGAMIGGLSAASAEIYKQFGGNESEANRLERDLNIIGQGVLIESGMNGHQLTRIDKTPTGEPERVQIGGLPKGEDFSAASTAIGHGDTTPAMEAKLGALYEEKGIHPAEVAHDAQTDVTITQSILSSDKTDMPAAYGAREEILNERQPQSAGAAATPPPSYTDAEKQILSKISIDEKSPQSKLTWDKLYTNVVDKLYPIGKAVKEAEPGLATEDNPYQLARLMSGHVGKADHFLNEATFDFNTYEANGASLKSILHPVRGDLNGFRAYATAARALELEGRGIKSGFDAGEAPSAPPLVSAGLDAARTVVIEGREKFAKPFVELVDYQNRVASYLRDSGVLSKAGYQAMVEANQLYVPFTRVMGIDEAAQARGGSTLQAKNPIKAIKGSARDIVDPIESVVRNTYHMIEMAEKNVVGTKLVDMLKRAGEELPEAPKAVEGAAVKDTPRAAAIADELGEVGVRKPADLADALAHATEPLREGEIAILRDGKRETYKVDPDLARAVKGLDAQSMGILERVLAYPASTLRAGAVLTPDFQLRHTIRDFLYATTTFKEGAFTPIDMAKGFSGLIMKDADYWNWLKGGGGNISMVGMDRQYLQADLRKLTGETGLVGRAWNVLADPDASMWQKTAAVGTLPFKAIDKFVLDPLRAVTQFAENASHLGAFKKSMRASERAEPEATDLRSQILRSAWVSRDTAVDAARMGANMRGYNMITAFANIKLQDTDRVVRAIIDNPVGALTKIGAAITAPSVLLWAANHDDPRYAEIPEWQKDMFWLVMTPDHVFRVPKPWAMGMIFGSAPERLLDAFVAGKPDAGKQYFKSLWATSGPDFVPTGLSPIIDQFANRSTFTNRTLIPSTQEKFLPEYQYTPYTTEATKALGQMIGAFPGMSQLKMDNSGWGGTARALTSPILMENYIRGWTGTLGMYALETADKALRMAGQLPDPPLPTNTLADIPVIRAFTVRYPSASAESVQTFQDDYAKAKSYFDTWQAMAKDGNVAAMQHIQDMAETKMFEKLDGFHETIGNLNQMVRLIYKNPDMPPDEKRQLIDQLYFGMIQVAQGGNQAIRAVREKAADVVAKPH